MRKPYEAGDRIIAALNTANHRAFNKSRLLLKFDELNIITAGTALNVLYGKLRAANEQSFLQIAEVAYREAYAEGFAATGHTGTYVPPGREWLIALFLAYSPVSKYVYNHEVDRKRAYHLESIMADREQKSRRGFTEDFEAARKRWQRMSTQWGIEVEDRAAIDGFVDAGVQRVRWMTAQDQRVCEVCKALGGKVFDIDKVPSKPHQNDRCYLVPVGRSEKT